ncbi:hypothetical protein [Egicoccus sp. AB-alg6-2]|uniref:hypothetical protein n=1 Tax=Egicoccus sp. AB-alg6-2 TaxID=3242692 RepID=UPI00359F0A12
MFPVSFLARLRRSSLLPALVPALLALVLGGCRLGVTGEMAVERDGSGTAALELSLDADAVARLDELALDPFAELSAAAVGVPAWTVTRAADEDEDGGMRVRLATEVADPDALTDAFRDLVADLAPEDPALLVDLDLEVASDGGVRLDGTVGLRPPATSGAVQDGEPIGPAGGELAALVEEAVRARFVVTLPGPLANHDADRVEAGGLLGEVLAAGPSTLEWEVPVGAERTVTARSDAPPLLDPLLVAGLAAALVVVLLATVWWWRRRR